MNLETVEVKKSPLSLPTEFNAGELSGTQIIEGEKGSLKLHVPVADFRTLPIPGQQNAKLGLAYVRVLDIPGALDKFMEVNPRVPSRTKAGVLSGPVIKGILETLRETPEEMVIKNQGIYLLVENQAYRPGTLYLTLSDKHKHGIVNGGHTYSAIREAIETATEDEIDALKEAYVRLHIFQGIDEDYVPEIAEGLNRSMQVDDPSLVNLQGDFDVIRSALKGIKGEPAIAYHQGDSGDVYVSELLVYLSMFNRDRFTDRKHPNALYNRQALGLKYFSEDMQKSKANMKLLIKKLPEFLWLADSIRKATPAAAKKNNFKFGAAKVEHGGRAGSSRQKGTVLPFLGEKMDYRVPNGWVYPMLAAFRANLKRSDKCLEWRMPLEKLLPDVIEDLVGVCVLEHRDNNMRPELIGKRESAYSQCYTRIELYLAKKNLLR